MILTPFRTQWAVTQATESPFRAALSDAAFGHGAPATAAQKGGWGPRCADDNLSLTASEAQHEHRNSPTQAASIPLFTTSPLFQL